MGSVRARGGAGKGERGRARDWLGWLGGGLLGAVLLVAAVAKSLDPRAFAEEISSLGLTGGLPPFALAIAVLGVEALLGALLVLNLRRLPVLIAATALVLLFVGITGRSAWRAARGLEDPTGACGCFGNLVERTPAEALVQDLLLLVPTLALAWIGRPGARRRASPRIALATAVGLGTAGFAVAAPGLPLDDRATRLRPGVGLEEICAGTADDRVCLADLAPELASGAHLVVLADVESEHFGRLADRLNLWARAGSEPRVAVLAEISPDRRQELYWTVGPAFELHDAPRAMLRPLYRTLPRSFRVEEGRVTATWTGLPPGFPGTDEAAPTDEDPTA